MRGGDAADDMRLWVLELGGTSVGEDQDAVRRDLLTEVGELGRWTEAFDREGLVRSFELEEDQLHEVLRLVMGISVAPGPPRNAAASGTHLIARFQCSRVTRLPASAL